MQDASMPAAHCLGLIGGLGPGATAHYYQALLRAHDVRGVAPDLLIAHADLGFVLEQVRAGALDALAGYLSSYIHRLAAAGAQVAAISAVTPHVCAAQLVSQSPLPLVDIIDAVATELRRRNLTRIALFGTRFVIESNLFGRLPDIGIVKPTTAEIDAIHISYTRIASDGRAAGVDIATLRQIAHRLCAEEGVQTIVLAGTDLSFVFDETDAGFPTLDATRAHIDAIMDCLLDTPR